MPSNALGAMISSHSHTHDLRRETFRRCAQIGEGSALQPARDQLAPLAQFTTRRPSLHWRCVDAAMLLAQVSAIAPAI